MACVLLAAPGPANAATDTSKDSSPPKMLLDAICRLGLSLIFIAQLSIRKKKSSGTSKYNLINSSNVISNSQHQSFLMLFFLSILRLVF
jgi:hypothetical protein